MSTKSLILITVFISNALAIQNIDTSKWEIIRNQLTKYHDSLLNEEIVTDLKKCHNYTATQDDYPVGIICSNYYELVLQINKTSSNNIFTTQTIKNELQKSGNLNEFCDRLKNSTTDNNLFTDIDMCKLSCLAINYNDLQYKKSMKPICKIIDFMLIILTNNTNINDAIPIDGKNVENPQILKITEKIQPNIVTNNKDQRHVQDNKIEINTNDNGLNNELKLKLQQDTIMTQKINTNVMNTLRTGTLEKTGTKLDELNDKPISKLPINIPAKTVDSQNIELPIIPTKRVEIKETVPSIDANTNEKKNQINEDPKLDNNVDIDDNDMEEDKLINGQDGNYYGPDADDDKIKNSLSSKLPNIKQNNKENNIKLQQQQRQESTFNKFNEMRNEFGNNEHKIILNDPFYEKSGSNFFTYLLIAMFGCILLYVAYHNKSKILALLLEGRRGQKGRGGRRKHTAAYRKLDSNLEEAISSPSSARSSQIIY